MRSTRLTLAVTALLVVTAFSGCSGDDGGDSESAPSDSASTEAPTGHVNSTCRVTVEISGDSTASWQGKGEVRVTDDGLAVYTAEDDASRLAVYSEDDAAPASVNLMTEDAQMSTPVGDDTGLDVDAAGRSATVDTAVEGADGATAQVTADFTCKKASG